MNPQFSIRNSYPSVRAGYAQVYISIKKGSVLITWAFRWLAIAMLIYFCALALNGDTNSGTLNVPTPGCGARTPETTAASQGHANRPGNRPSVDFRRSS